MAMVIVRQIKVYKSNGLYRVIKIQAWYRTERKNGERP